MNSLNLDVAYIASPPDPVETLLNGKTFIAATRLEILASEISERLGIRELNLQRVNQDLQKVDQMLQNLAKTCNYLMRDHREKAIFYQRLFDLEKERREQDAECWRDVAFVMRDFLFAWEAHEQAKAKAMFLR